MSKTTSNTAIIITTPKAVVASATSVDHDIMWSRPLRRPPRTMRLSLIVGLFFLITHHCSAGTTTHFYDSCFESIVKADIGNDTILDAAEYTNFLYLYTRGVATKPIPQDLVNVFMAMADNTTMLLTLPGIQEGASSVDVDYVSRFCFAVHGAFQKILKITITSDQCVGALMPADVDAPKGQLSPEEYITFLRHFTGEPYEGVSSLEDLNLITRSVFNDMEMDGFISGGAGPEYLGEFCLRAMIAHGLDKIANQLYPDTAVKPSGSNNGSHSGGPSTPTNTTEASTTTVTTKDSISTSPGNTTEPSNPTSTTSTEPITPTNTTDSSEDPDVDTYSTVESDADTSADAVVDDESDGKVEMSNELMEKCFLAMIFIDKDRDNIMGQDEFGALADRLRVEIEGGVSYKKAKTVYDEHYSKVAKAHNGKPSLKGSKPSTKAALDKEIATLNELCQATFDAIQAAKDTPDSNADVLVQNTVIGGGDRKADEIKLEPEVLKNCKSDIFVSDRDRNGGLDVDEFVFLLNRLQDEDKAPFEGFGDLHDAFHVIYRDMSSYNEGSNSFMVSTAGSKPGTIPTDDESSHLESVCESVFFTLKELELE